MLRFLDGSVRAIGKGSVASQLEDVSIICENGTTAVGSLGDEHTTTRAVLGKRSRRKRQTKKPRKNKTKKKKKRVATTIDGRQGLDIDVNGFYISNRGSISLGPNARLVRIKKGTVVIESFGATINDTYYKKQGPYTFEVNDYMVTRYDDMNKFQQVIATLIDGEKPEVHASKYRKVAGGNRVEI